MASFTVQQVLQATGGQLLVAGPATRFTGVSTDTRSLQPDDLFVALRGERFDGHDYLQAARAAGAAGALVEHEIPGVQRRATRYGDWTVIEVTDTLYAYGKLAQTYRRRFDIPLIAITGSAGKTTTKELTAAILAQGRRVLKSEKNENNDIGLPKTLLNLASEYEAAVVEMGMRARGEIDYLAAIAQPTIGVITNIGLTHLERLGSPEAIALAKAELLDAMPAGAIAVLPANDAFFPLLREHARGGLMTFGEHDADVVADDLALGDDLCATFTLRGPWGSFPVTMGGMGMHLVPDALAAATAAILAGALPAEVQAGLAAYRAEAGRMHLVETPAGVRLIDDSYNANPDALRGALRTLAAARAPKRVAILGDMLELGPTGPEIHREIGAYAMTLGIDALLAVGDLGREIVAGADDPRAAWYPDNASLAAAARALLAPGDVALVKASHGLHLDEVVRALTD
jgi:UDP-N-acetylmuramoyl-tripeptide--D-alanyl-D-alanine ligase